MDADLGNGPSGLKGKEIGMLVRSRILQVVTACLLLVLAVSVVDGCARKRTKKKTKQRYIPTVEEINQWIQEKKRTDKNMATVQPGRYPLGDNTYKGNPERVVKLEKPFKIDRFEVTNHDWFMFLWATKDSQVYYPTIPIVMGDFDTDKWAKNIKDAKFYEYDFTRKKHPVRSIAYSETEQFAKFVDKRMPTADEWEIAARGPDGRRYPWGNSYTKADWKTKAWTSFLIRGPGGKTEHINDTIPVDKLPGGQSWCGCYNMADNVSEWTSSKVRTGQGVWKKRPRNERPFAQVVKGGSFTSRQVGALNAQFFDLLPDVSDQFRVGFRCVRD